MSDQLTRLIEKAKGVRMTAQQQEQQRRSFANGNGNREDATGKLLTPD